MFFLKAPESKDVERFLAERNNDDFSYPEIGATRNDPPSGYNIDRNRIKIGVGPEAFKKAKTAIRNWKMFGMNWVTLTQSDTPIEVGRTVAILVEHFGFYSLNAARIVYVIDDEDRFGFAYGTLKEHGEIGEERFSVEFDELTGEVWYYIYAFSRPGSLLAKLGYPLTRYLQKSFAQDSKIAMLNAVSDHPDAPQNS